MRAYFASLRAFRETGKPVDFTRNEDKWVAKRTDDEKQVILEEGGVGWYGVGLLYDAALPSPLDAMVRYAHSRQGRVNVLDEERCYKELYRLNWEDAHKWMDAWEKEHAKDPAFIAFGATDIPSLDEFMKSLDVSEEMKMEKMMGDLDVAETMPEE